LVSFALTGQIDTTTPGGKLIFHLMGALAEFERDLIRERTNAGLAAAKARGRKGGRPRKLKTNGKVALARQMFADQSHSIPEICAALGISRATLYRYYGLPESLAISYQKFGHTRKSWRIRSASHMN
jgi:DNA invertase Pin-like site-specific DNA recombinase